MNWVSDLLSLLGSNPVLNLIFLILAVVSLLVSVFLYVRSKREKLPCYNMVSHTLLRDSVSEIEGIDITYRAEPIKNLTRVVFALWNRGGDTIDRSDLAPTDPIRVEVSEGTRIIPPRILFVAEKANNFSLSVDRAGRSLVIDFDYFHTAEGVVLNFYHTGPSQKDVTIRGTVKGAKLVDFTKRELEAFESVLKFFGVLKMLRRVPRRRLERFPLLLAVPVILLPLTPFLLPAMVLDMVRQVTRRVPREFELD